MLPDYLNSYNPLKERLSGKNSSADQQKIKTALQQILDGKGGGPEFGAVMGSAEAKALRMLGGNTGRFAGNYVLKNYDKLDPMVKELVGTKGNPLQASMYGDDTDGSVEKGEEVRRSLPRSVQSAISRQAKKEMRIKKSKSKRPSFMERMDSDMDNIGYQEGGMVPVDGEGNMPPEAVASDVVNGAPMGMVDVPNGGGPVDDGVPTELPEGAVVINAAAIRFHGTETIDNLINTAVDALLSEGVQISMEDPNPEDNVPVAISNGEYVIPPEVAEKIGYKKLEDMNERGRAYLQKQAAQEKQQAEAQQQPQQPPQQPPEGFMGESMPPQQEGPPQAPVQSEQQAMAMMGMMDGGRVNYAAGGGGGIGATARVQAPVAPTAPAVATAEAPAPSNIISQAKDKFTGWFAETFLGGSMDPAPSAVNAMGMLPQKAPEGASERTKAKPDRGASFKSAIDPLYDSTLAELGPVNQFTPNVQRAAEGGFVGDYNYAQPQQATMGTPFPNAVDSSPQQSQSFLQSNDAKKKSRVELADGTLSELAQGMFPRPDSTEFKEPLPQEVFVSPTPRTKPELPQEVFVPPTPRAKPEPPPIHYNNPGNIKTLYNGKVAKNTQFAGALDKGYGSKNRDGTQKGMFSDPILGIRALFVDIETKFKKDSIKNLESKDARISKIIKIYAPSGSENPNQSNYISFVTKYVNDNPELNERRAIVEGIIAFENTETQENRYTQEMIDEAENLSGIDFKRKDVMDIETARERQTKASGGFISLEEGGVAERASSESKGSFYESRQSGFEKLHEQALDLADVRRKQLKGNTLAQGSGNKELDENYQTEFDSLIRNMTYEITAGTESIRGFTKKTSAEEKEKLVDQLTAFYEGKANEGITERESLHLDFKEDFDNMPGSERMAEADINMDRTMSKNPDKNPSRQTRAIPNILEQEGSEAYTGFLTPDFDPLATQRNI